MPDGDDFASAHPEPPRWWTREQDAQDRRVARIRSEAERETVQQIVAWMRENAIECRAADSDEAGHRWHCLANAIDRKFGGEDKGGEHADR